MRPAFKYLASPRRNHLVSDRICCHSKHVPCVLFLPWKTPPLKNILKILLNRSYPLSININNLSSFHIPSCSFFPDRQQHPTKVPCYNLSNGLPITATSKILQQTRYLIIQRHYWFSGCFLLSWNHPLFFRLQFTHKLPFINIQRMFQQIQQLTSQLLILSLKFSNNLPKIRIKRFLNSILLFLQFFLYRKQIFLTLRSRHLKVRYQLLSVRICYPVNWREMSSIY